MFEEEEEEENLVSESSALPVLDDIEEPDLVLEGTLYILEPKDLSYCSVPKRRACTFINFEKKIPPASSYFGLHVY